MRCFATARSLGLVLMCASTVGAQDNAPALLGPAPAPPPAVAPGSPPPPAELPPVLEAQPLPGTEPILAVPGLAIPGGGPTRTPRAAISGRPTRPGMELPPLVGPADALGPAPFFSPPPWAGTSTTGASGGAAPTPTPPRENIPGRTTLPLPDPRLGIDAARRGDLSQPPPPDASSRPRLFGRWQPPPFLRGRASPGSEDSIAVEPRSDPAADAALKRRLENQIQTAAGSRLHSLDVKVVDRDVTIHARVNRFWHRRSVKSTIQSLPGLAGYKTHIEVVD